MLYVLALLMPFLAVMLAGRFWVGAFLLVLQITLVGWVPAAVAAMFIIHSEEHRRLEGR